MSKFEELLESIPPEKRRLGRYLGDLLVSIEETIERKRMSQKELATRMGMEPPQLSRLLSDLRNYLGNPTLETIARLSTALETELLSFPVFEEWSRNTSGESSSTIVTVVSGEEGKRSTYVNAFFGNRGDAGILVLTAESVINPDAEGRVTIERAAA